MTPGTGHARITLVVASQSDGRECGVDRSLIHTIGKAGVRLAGGDRQTLTPARHFVTNSRIHIFARLVKTYCPAVGLADILVRLRQFNLEPKRIQLNYPGLDSAAKLALVEATQGGRPGMEVLPPLLGQGNFSIAGQS